MNSQISSHALLRARFFFILTLRAISLVCCLTIHMLAQNTQTTENKADQNLKSSVRVNPVTLAMEFSLPLGGYPGRGGNSTPIVLNYSSKVWNMKMVNHLHEVDPSADPTFNYIIYDMTNVGAFFGEKTNSGWTSSLQPLSIIDDFERYNQSGELMGGYFSANFGASLTSTGSDFCFWTTAEVAWETSCSGPALISYHRCCPPDDFCYEEDNTQQCLWVPGPLGSPTPPPQPGPTPTPEIQHSVKRLRIQMPDGSQHEFRQNDTVYDCSVSPNDCGPNNTGTFLSVDGSEMRLERKETQPDNQVKDVLYMPDGSRYFFSLPNSNSGVYSPVADKFIDRNGNTSTYDALYRKWTDTLGRELKDPLRTPFSVDPQHTGTEPYSVKGIGGADLTYSLSWDTLENVFEDPQHMTTKLLGDDNCGSPLPSPATGAHLWDSDPQSVYTDGPNKLIVNQKVCASSAFNPIVLAGIVLPNGLKYQFKYNEYGEITKILYPTGGYERFEYAHIDPMGVTAMGVYGQSNRGVHKHYVSYDGSTETEAGTYNDFFELGAGSGTESVSPSGIKSQRILYQSTNSSFGFEEPRAGMVKDERVRDANGVLRSRTLTDWIAQGPQTGGYFTVERDPRIKRTATITFQPGSNSALATLSETEYETPGSGAAPTEPKYFAHINAKSRRSYHYVNVPTSLAASNSLDWNTIESWFTADKLASISETDYSYDAAYQARGIIGRPIETRVLNPMNTADILAKSQPLYDQQNYFDNGYTTTNWENPNSNLRGLVTTSRTWVKETDTWLESHTMYDNFGNVRKVWDASGDTGKFVETQYDSANKYAYPKMVISPAPATGPSDTHSTSETSSVTMNSDPTTGLPLSVTDEFGQVTTTEYDGMLRAIRVNPVVVSGSPTGPKTETIYGSQLDSNGQLLSTERFVKIRKQLDANNWDEATTWFDGLGRTIKTQAKDSQGDVFVETHYDDFGRLDRVTNPYRAGETVYWSKTRYDELGRAVETYAPTELANLASAQSLGTTSFDISTVPGHFGTVVETKDAANKRSRSITNALGQLIVVEEPDSNGNLQPLPQSTPPPSPTPTPTPGASPTPIPTPTPHGGGGDDGGGCLSRCQQNLAPIDFPSFATYYTYNVQGKLVQVTQGAQNRFFKYDSLGRLVRVSQPEQEVNSSLHLVDAYNTSGNWTAGFTYDVLGNVVQATDANGVNILNEYDRAGRVTKRCYTKPGITLNASVTTCAQISSNELSTDTQTVNFYYDGKGLDTPQSPNFVKGKLTKVDNTVSASVYSQFDNFGRLSEARQVTDGQTYTSTFQYNLSGALVQETYPSGRVVKNEFESDGDLSRIYGNANAGSPERTYANSFLYTTDGKIERLKLGNGLWEKANFNNLMQVTELNLGHGLDGDLWKLGYQYGEIDGSGNVDANKNTGNIARQTLSFNGLAQPFIQNYKYDSLYRLTEAQETNNGSQTWKETYAYDRYGNRSAHAKFQATTLLTADNHTDPTIDQNTNRFNPNQGYTYDKNGNLTVDADSRAFTFNGDNKQTVIKDATGKTVGQYSYDGEGKRVKKQSYDSSGVLDETTIFVYSSGKLVAEYSTKALPQNPTTSYTATDKIGSPRVITNALGEVVSRRDFMPFGEAITPDGANRTNGLKYTFGDDIRQKFTGYQKDEETGLDFAEARMYQDLHGRFTAVDPLLASGKSANPQSFNRFVYCLNNPLLLSDPGGLQAGFPGKWYQQADDAGNPIEGGAVSYIYEGGSTKNFREITSRNRAGQLILPDGRINGQPVGPDNVVRLNEAGPYRPSTAELAANYSGDNVVGLGPVSTLLLSDFELKGYDTIHSDAYLARTIEPNLGVQDASIGFYSIVMPLAAGGKAVMEMGLGAMSRSGAAAVGPEFEEGSFSIVDWTGYPEGAPRPEGPFRLLEGEEYKSARKLADSTNKALHVEYPDDLDGVQIHEIHPVKFGGSPTDMSNKLFLSQPEHQPFNSFWLKLQRNLEGK